MTLIDIIDYGSVDDTHLVGQARFSDGKRYRFVMHDGKVDSMALPKRNWKGEEVFEHNYRKPRLFPKRAALIEAAYHPYLKLAREADMARRAEEDAKQAEQNRVGLLTRALQEAAPELIQRVAALRTDAGFGEAVSYLPELGALVDQAECVIAGKPFDAVGYAGGGGAPRQNG